jgi:hypothetical protein
VKDSSVVVLCSSGRILRVAVLRNCCMIIGYLAVVVVFFIPTKTVSTVGRCRTLRAE